MPLGLVLVQLLVIIVVLGAAFGAAAWWFVKWKGTSAVTVFWVATAITLGTIGAARVLSVQLRLGVTADRQPPFGAVALMFVVFLLVVLLPVAMATVVRWRRSPGAGLGAALLQSAGWSIVGLCIAFSAMIVLDLLGVLWIPRSAPIPSGVVR